MEWDTWADTMLYSNASREDKIAAADAIAARAPEPLATAMDIIIVGAGLDSVSTEDMLRLDQHCESVGAPLTYPTPPA
jgi:hypothetical protein